jgi:thioredoxin 1
VNILHANSMDQLTAVFNKAGDRLVVVDFFTTWCGPCKRIAPTFSRLAAEYKDRVFFVKVDGDQARALVSNYGVQGFPTFKFFVNQSEVESFSGADEYRLASTIEQYAVVQLKEKHCPFRHFPLREQEQVFFKDIAFDKVMEKVVEVNKGADEAKEEYALTAMELKQLEDLIKILQDKGSYHSSVFTPQQYTIVDKLLSWPSDHLSPAEHLIRILALHPHAATTFSNNKPSDVVGKLCTIASTDGINKVVVLLAIRALCNFFSRRKLAVFIGNAKHEEVFDMCSKVLQSNTDKNVQMACLSLYINYAIFLRESERDADEGVKVYALSSMLDWLNTDAVKSNDKLVYRAFVVIGTLVYRDQSVKDIADGLDLPGTVAELAKVHVNVADVQAAAAEVLTAFKQE